MSRDPERRKMWEQLYKSARPYAPGEAFINDPFISKIGREQRMKNMLLTAGLTAFGFGYFSLVAIAVVTVIAGVLVVVRWLVG